MTASLLACVCPPFPASVDWRNDVLGVIWMNPFKDFVLETNTTEEDLGTFLPEMDQIVFV